MRFIALILAGSALAGLSATAAVAKAQGYFECPVPAGYQAAMEKFSDLFIADELRDSKDVSGWYAPSIETATVLYQAPDPVVLPVADFPYLIGTAQAYAAFNSKLAAQVICGFYVSLSGWVVTVEWEGHGLASFDIREALAGVPVPGRGDTNALGSTALPLPIHVFRFSIDGQDFAYVMTGTAIAMNRVFRPDLAAIQSERSNLDDDLFPSLNEVFGMLVASAGFAERTEWRDIGVDDTAGPDRSFSLRVAGTGTQPVDVTETPIYLGLYMASRSPSAGVGKRAAKLVLQDNILTISLPDGRSKSLDVSHWIDVRMGLGVDGIAMPSLRFDIDGQAFNYVVNMMMPPAHILQGDLFTSDPPLVKNARERSTEPKRQ